MKQPYEDGPELTAWARMAEPPEPGAEFAERMWAQIEPKLAAVKPLPARRMQPYLMAWAAVAAAALLTVWMWPAHQAAISPVQLKTAAPVSISDPVLVAAVNDHLDRTQALLVELSHAGDHASAQGVDLANEQKWARQLLASNRLYQQGAVASGDGAMTHLLETLEPVLVELSHSPAQVPMADWQRINTRIASSGVLFQVRVVNQKLQVQVSNEERNGDL